MQAETLALFEIAQNLIGAARDIANGVQDGGEKLRKTRAQLEVVLSRLGFDGVEEHATRNAVTVALMMLKQESVKLCEKSKNLSELNLIVMFERSVGKSLLSWMESRKK